MHFTKSALTLGVALSVPAVHAWKWEYESPDGEQISETGEDVRDCTPMDMERGATYHWEPQSTEETFCINLFTDDKCQDRNGYSCNEWGPRELGQDKVGSFLVNHDPHDLDTTGTETGTATGTETGTMTGTATEPTTTGDSTDTETGASSSLVDLTSMSTTMSPTTSAESTESTAEPTETESSPSETASGSATTSAPAGDSASTLSGGSIMEVVLGAVAGIALMGFY